MLISNYAEARAFLDGIEISEDYYFQIQAKEWQKNWEKTLLPSKERIKIFMEEMGKIQVNAIRKKILMDKYRIIFQQLHEARINGEDTQNLQAKANGLKFAIEILEVKDIKNYQGFTEEEIKEADSKDIGQFVELNARGFINCPFHHERTPSLHINKNLFYCFGCGEKGRTIKFIMRLQNLTFPEAIKKLL